MNAYAAFGKASIRWAQATATTTELAEGRKGRCWLSVPYPAVSEGDRLA